MAASLTKPGFIVRVFCGQFLMQAQQVMHFPYQSKTFFSTLKMDNYHFLTC